jgi:pimeloyl-ACP methyl ester carboxylesterase
MSRHMILLPGLLAPVQTMHPLARYLRRGQQSYAVTTVPLQLSIAGYETIVDKATKRIARDLFQGAPPELVVVFGHSFGGRIACGVVSRLKDLSPSTRYILVTAGSPLGKKFTYLSWWSKAIFSTSKAYRIWPLITQPGEGVASRKIGYYSKEDKTVTPAAAQSDFTGELYELAGFSHHDFISPTKMGPVLLRLLSELS